MDREQARQYIKEQLESYLKGKGIKTGHNFKCLNPAHQDNNPSMSIDKSKGQPYHAKCFASSCNAYYDTFDLIGLDYGLTDQADIFNKAYELFHIDISKIGPTSKQHAPNTQATQRTQEAHSTQEHKGATDFITYFIQANAQVGKTDYFKKRGINPEVIARFTLGYEPAFKTKEGGNYATWKAVIIPTSPTSYTVRNTDPASDKGNRVRKRGASQLFNNQALQSGKPVYVVEGEFDALSLVEAGAEALALGSTANVEQLIKNLKREPPAGGIILSLDNDKEGQEASEKLSQAIKALNIPYLKANITGEYKDPNEALTADREQFAQAVQDTQDKLKAQLEAEQNAERDAYLKTSTAYHLQDFLNGITASVNTPYIPTGFKGLDQILDGGLYEGLYIMGAVSSLGKTTFLMQIADQIAQDGQEVLIFSLEMARSELMAKSISRLTFLGCDKTNQAKTTRGITTGKRYANYNQAEHELIRTSIEHYGEYAKNIYISEGMGDIGADQVRATIARHIKLTGNKPVIIIDYLQLLSPYDQRSTDKQNIDKAVLELKRISRDYKLPVLAISSFNRQNYSQPVSMESFKESGAIEYSSDVLLGLQAKGAGNKNFDINEAKRKDPRELELKILKNRNGATGKTLYYDYYPLFNFFVDNGEREGWEEIERLR